MRTLRLEERACEMKRLWVKGEYRGLRLGRQLAEEAIGWAKRMGFAAMYLDTVPAAMPEANSTLRRAGFCAGGAIQQQSCGGHRFLSAGFDRERKDEIQGSFTSFWMTTSKTG